MGSLFSEDGDSPIRIPEVPARLAARRGCIYTERGENRGRLVYAYSSGGGSSSLGAALLRFRSQAFGPYGVPTGVK